MSEEQPATTPRTSPFDAIRHIDEQGNEYWSARELSKLLGYTQYNKFINVIRKAEKSCKEAGGDTSDHFTHLSESIKTGKGAMRTLRFANPGEEHPTASARGAETRAAGTTAYFI
jgi:prophage antirepressor-like protein